MCIQYIVHVSKCASGNLNMLIVLVYVGVVCGLVPECSDSGVMCECENLNTCTCLFE